MFQADFHFSLQQITLTEFLTGTPCSSFTCYSMNKFLVIEMILINEMILKQRTLAFPFKEVDDLTKVWRLELWIAQSIKVTVIDNFKSLKVRKMTKLTCLKLVNRSCNLLGFDIDPVTGCDMSICIYHLLHRTHQYFCDLTPRTSNSIKAEKYKMEEGQS